MYRVIERYGPVGAPDLRQDLALGNGDDWKGRADGMTRELRQLQVGGLIRQVGTRPSGGGPATRLYEVTPEDGIEKAVKNFKRKNPGRKRDMSGGTARVAEYRRMETNLEKEKGPYSARGQVIEARRRVVELSGVLRRIEPLLYWSEKNFPDNEKEVVYDELVALAGWVRQMEAAVDGERGDRQLREKIRALRAKADSTLTLGNDHEAETYYEKARELEDRL
jgi:hypothetical protein